MYLYSKKDNFIYRLNTITILTFVTAVFILALVFSHPVYLLGLFIAVGAVIISSGNLDQWKIYLKITIAMILFIIIINAVVSGAGSTVLLSSPAIPVLGTVTVTLEALVFAVGMSLRLLIIISIFCFYTYVVNPDKALKIFSRLGNKSVLAITMSTRLFPLMVQDFQRISESQRCRGLKYDTGRWWQRVKNLVPLISVLLQSSLDRSIKYAESMCARGYGNGKRSYFNKELWRPGDYIVLAAILTGFITGIWNAVIGWSGFNYYPNLQTVEPGQIVMTIFFIIIFITPAILNWGWIHWEVLKLKI